MAQLVGDGEGGAQSVVLADAAAPVRIANRPQLGQAWSDKHKSEPISARRLKAYAGHRSLTQGVTLVPRSADVLPAVARRTMQSAELLTSKLMVSSSGLESTIQTLMKDK